MCAKKGVPPKYVSYGRNIGKLYITGKVIGQTLARTYVGRISTDVGAPSGENMIFKKIAKLIFLPLGTPDSSEMLLDMVFHILLQKYIVFLCFQFRHFLKFMFSPLGAPQLVEILPTYDLANVCPMTFPVIYSFPMFRPYERYFGGYPFFGAHRTIFQLIVDLHKFSVTYHPKVYVFSILILCS